MEKHEILHRILHPGVVAIMRADSSGELIDAARAMAEGGVTCMEVTLTTPGALEVIRAVVAELGDRVLMGAGTVLDEASARLAILAGAEFLVTPVVRPEVAAVSRRYGKAVIMGAFTPTEALTAHEAGADFVKLFPAEGLGPGYVRALRAPLPQVQVIPTGGVDAKNCGEWIRAGAAAVAAGSSLAGKEVLKNRDWAALTEASSRFVEAVAAARG